MADCIATSKTAGQARETHQAAESIPSFEKILTWEQESFLWRLDDYPNAYWRWNFHPECEIHLIRNASGTMFVGDFIGEFSPGSLVLVGSGLPHDWVTHLAQGDCIPGRDVVVQFNPGHLAGAAEFLPELREITSLLEVAKRGLLFTGRTARDGARLLEQLGQAKGLDRLTGFLAVLQLFARSGEYEVLSSPEFSPIEGTEQMTRMQRATGYIHDRFTEEIKIGDVAHVVGMTESTFSRFFQKNAGRSFTGYLRALRIGRACRLLSESDRPITEICYEAGYTNLSNFNRTFLKERGMTPTRYRSAAHARWSNSRVSSLE